jgi:type IV secretory pathway TraG/TraD family ATPase VirD4
MRSRRISCAVLVQALSQLRAAYDKHANTILGNCALHLSEQAMQAGFKACRVGTN